MCLTSFYKLCIKLRKLQNNPIEHRPYHCRDEVTDEESERVSHFPQVTHLGNGRAGLKYKQSGFREP